MNKPESDIANLQRLRTKNQESYIAASGQQVMARLSSLADLQGSMKIIRHVLPPDFDWLDIFHKVECIYGKEGKHALILDIGRISVLDASGVRFLSAMHEKWQTRGCFFGVLSPRFPIDMAARSTKLTIFNSISEVRDYILIGANCGIES